MRRDMDVVRTIALAAENEAVSPVAGDDQRIWNEHIRLMGEGGLLQVHEIRGQPPLVINLTELGRSFAELARDEDRWDRVKRRVERVGGAPFDVWMTLLQSDIDAHLKAPPEQET